MASRASSDEGEIRDGGAEKATTSLPQYDGSSVDRPSRTRHDRLSSTPEYDRARDRRSRDRSRSPYYEKQSRGSKRAREDEYPDRSRGDSRRFKVHYEDAPQNYQRRSRISYDDIDQGGPAGSELRYDDRDVHAEKRARTRSRSPYRSDRGGDRSGRGRGGPSRRDGRYDGGYAHDNRRPISHLSDVRSRESNDLSVSKRGPSPLPADNARQEAKTTKGYLQQQDNSSAHQNSGRNPAGAPVVETPEEEPLDEAAMIEERRRRREAIKAKYKASATPLLLQALQLPSGASTPGQIVDSNATSAGPTSPVISTPGTPADTTDPSSPSAFAFTNDLDLANTRDASAGEEDGPSAADYDPTVDMREDKARDDHRHEEVPAGDYDETKLTSEQDVLLPSREVDEPIKPRGEVDMFAEDDDDDDDDMFAEESVANGKSLHSDPFAKAVPIPQAKTLDIGMLDNWDDPEGYYKIILGELLNGRYHVQSSLGQGMFSGVVRAVDVKTQKLVAIKLIRNNETMRRAGLKEIEILQKINEADPEDKKHMIRLERHFEHKGHLCMVFENLSSNLREVLKKFGRDVGINLRAVRAYAQQMFLGLSLMRKCNVLHADLKPDNILVNETRNMLKICDLGSASDASDNEITPYLVSRFYRAPEIILGMPYDFAIDVWSVGCTLYELYTGKILFTGRTNNQMLRSIMDCRGKITTKILKRSQFAHIHFDEMANFRSVEQDKLTGKDTIKILSFVKPSRDLRTRLNSASKGLTDVETKELALFADLLDRCLALNPEKRCTPAEALRHPFIMKTMR